MVLGAFITLLRPTAEIDARFAYHQLAWSDTQDRIRSTSSTTTNISNVSTKKLKQMEMVVPPLEQQQRIVAEIDKQFSRLDKAVASLNRVKVNLKRYKAAVEGKLTEEWRKQNPNVEPASKLLERILTERRAKWEQAELAKMKAKGKEPKNDKWKSRYKGPSCMNASAPFSPLPQPWSWVSVDQVGTVGEQPVLTGPFGSHIGKKDFIRIGVPVLTIGCLQERGIVLDKAKYVTEKKAAELSRYELRDGDLLFSRMAAVGRVGFVNKELEGAIFNYHIMRLRLSVNVIDPIYFVLYVRGAKAVIDYVREVNHGATRDGINTDQLLSMPVALPTVKEQQQIVIEVDERMSVVVGIEQQIVKGLSEPRDCANRYFLWLLWGELSNRDKSKRHYFG